MMILDTIVVLELMNSKPDPMVARWLNAQRAETLWLTSMTVFDIVCGIELLHDAEQKDLEDRAFKGLLENTFTNRILAFDSHPARKAGQIFARLRQQGLNPEYRSIQIAALAATFHATIATNNPEHFVNAGIATDNPWIAISDA